MKIIKNLKAEEIRKSILQLAIQGKLVKQNPNDEPASELVKRIYAEKQKLIKDGKIKRDKNESYIFKGDDNCYYEKIGNNAPVKLEDLPFDIPDNWTWIRQKNICWLDNGTKTKGNKLPYLEAKVIRGQSDPIYLDEGVIVNPSHRVILVDGENSGEIMTPPFKGYMGSTFKIFSAISQFNYNYLLCIFSLNKDKYKNSKTGVAIPHLNKNLFKESYIAVPPFIEQERIFNRIDQIESLLFNYENIEEKLSVLEQEFPEKLKKSILQYAIEGKLVKQNPNDEPASILLERIKAEKEKLIKEGKIKRDKNESYIYQGDDKNYYENLQLKISLGNLISVTSGKSIKVNQLTSNGLYPVYGGNGIIGKCNNFLVGPNTIVIGRVGAKCGCVHKTTTNSFISDNALIVTLQTKQILVDYLIVALKSINFTNLISSTAQPLVSGKLIYPIEIPIFSINRQNKILVRLNKIFNQLDFINN